jgi:hypothetical protein
MAARTFGPAPEWEPVLAELQSSGLPTYLVREGDDLTLALGQLPGGRPGVRPPG